MPLYALGPVALSAADSKGRLNGMQQRCKAGVGKGSQRHLPPKLIM
jgi:hypothetical protein